MSLLGGVTNAFRAEWLRLRTPRAALALPVSAGLGALYAAGLCTAAEQKLLGGPSGFWALSAALSGLAVTGAALGALFSASSLAHDVQGGLLRTALTRPLARRDWVLGRLAALCLGALCCALCAALGAAGAAGARFGFHAATEGEYVLATGAALSGQLALATALSLVAQAAAVTLGGAVGLWLGAGGPAVVATATAGAACAALSRWQSVERLLPIAQLAQALDRVARLSLGLAGPGASDGLGLALLSAGGWLVAGLLLAAAVLERKDVTT